MKKRILVTDKVHDLLINGLKKHGFEVDYFPKMPYEEVKLLSKDFHGIIINSKVICDRAFLNQNKHLDFIGRLGSGLDIIDLPEAQKLGIAIINSPEGNANAVAEHAMGFLLSLANNLCIANKEVKAFLWNREANRGFELEGKTIGIIGFGHTGSAFAKKLSSFEMNILTYDKYKILDQNEVSVAKQVSLEHLLKQSDIISIHLPLTQETVRMVDASLISQCKVGTIFINTSRGPIVDTSDLLDALQSGHIRSAALDVLENEKLDQLTSAQEEVYQKLFSMDNVLLSPHIAGWTKESLIKIAQYLLTKIENFYQLR